MFVGREVADNRFQIAGGRAGMKVSWMLTGTRQDAYARKHPIVVEEAKPLGAQGKCLNPDAFGKPASLREGPSAIGWAARNTR